MVALYYVALNVNCLPLPAGQIVKYRVPSKYFNQPHETKEDTSSLYDLLTQIHYGGEGHTVVVNLSDVESEDVSNEITPAPERTTLTSTNESPEVILLIQPFPSRVSNYCDVFIRLPTT